MTKNFNHLFSFLSYFTLANEKYHYLPIQFPHYQTQHTCDCQKGTNYFECFCFYFLTYIWLVIEDSQVTTIALINVSSSVANYHTACSLIHVLDNAISLEAKKTGHSVFKKYPIIIPFFPPSFLLFFFFDRPPLLFTQLFFFYVQNEFIIV